MALTCLVYASRARADFSESQLIELTKVSAERNAFRDISGALLYCGGFFVQMLEGQEWVVREVYEKICKDPRHHDVQELINRPIAGRSFGGWGMSCLHEQASLAAEQRKIRKIISQLDRSTLPSALGIEAQALLIDLKTAIERQSAVGEVRRVA